MQSVTSAADAEKLLLYHGERIVDLLGAEINQIERSIQVLSIESTYIFDLTHIDNEASLKNVLSKDILY